MTTCAVIVPVMRRPHRVAPFLDSLAASGADATAYFIVDEDDDVEITAIRTVGGNMIINTGDPAAVNPKGFPVKCNVGYENTTEPWLLFVGDDVHFHAGWLDEALRVAGDEYHLIATADLLNHSVMQGRLATHPLMRRSWIDEHGSSWEGPGQVCHVGYDHIGVDLEWSAVAIDQGVFRFAERSVVEHLHWLNHRSDKDWVYQRGQQRTLEDNQVWRERYNFFRRRPA